MKKGYVALVLHSHLPFVRHPKINDPLEERWLFEAINECYLPLIKGYENLIKDGKEFKITMSITPPLMEMLDDDYLNDRYLEHLNKLIELADKEIIRTKGNERLNETSKFYKERFDMLLDTYNRYDKRVLNAFKHFNKRGNLEIITCSATHALLPLMEENEEVVKAQLTVGVECYKKHMGKAPVGIWLPECAYTYSLEKHLKELGIKYFISENQGILNGSPSPKYDTFAPVVTNNGIVAFGRDEESSTQVWSSFMGYPGDPDYREFYRDIGFELDSEYIGPYINAAGIRIDTGIKYNRITGGDGEKDLYCRDWAMEKVESHSTHFVSEKNRQIEGLKNWMEVPPILTCPYDTELFGHWWFEGPDFIEKFMSKSCDEGNNYELITPREYIEKHPSIQLSTPSPASWGENSDFSVWINGGNDWIYRDIHSCQRMMIKLANSYKRPSEVQKRALNQAARELMLAESSDWPFIIKTDTSVQYATVRLNEHMNNFSRLAEEIMKNAINLKFLNELEETNNIFENMDFRIYRSK